MVDWTDARQRASPSHSRSLTLFKFKRNSHLECPSQETAFPQCLRLGKRMPNAMELNELIERLEIEGKDQELRVLRLQSSCYPCGRRTL